jgi:flagellin
MGLRINTNLGSMAAVRNISNTAVDQAKSYDRLSSGNRITTAGDDAAGLAISESLRSQVRSMNQAERNSNDGISFAQVAEGGLNEIGNLMVRLRELAIQASSDTVGDKERGFIDLEAKSVIQEVDRIANVTTFNGTPLLNGQSSKGVLDIQVGIHGTENDRIEFNTQDVDARAGTLGIDGLDYTTVGSARDSLDKIDNGTSMIFRSRAVMGAIQNRLQAAVNNLGVSKENFSEARSRIADVDVADEASNMVRRNILQNAGVSVLAQANQTPMSALKLLS